MRRHRFLSALIAGLVGLAAIVVVSIQSPSAFAQTPQVAGGVTCTDSGTGQANCIVILQSTVAPGGSLVSTLPVGETFVSCNVASILGTCTVNGAALTVLCTNGCGAGSQLTEVVQGSAATALNQTVVTTATGLGIGQTSAGTAQCVDQGAGVANCTVTLLTSLATGNTVTLTLPAGLTFISCTSTNVGTCAASQGTAVATFSCYSVCVAGTTINELVAGPAATANTQLVVAPIIGINGYPTYNNGYPYTNNYPYYNNTTNPYFNGTNPYTYGLTGYVNGYGGCSFVANGVCTGSSYVTSPYSAYGYGGYGYGGYGYGGYSGYGGYGYGGYGYPGYGYGYGGYSGYPYYP